MLHKAKLTADVEQFVLIHLHAYFLQALDNIPLEKLASAQFDDRMLFLIPSNVQPLIAMNQAVLSP